MYIQKSIQQFVSPVFDPATVEISWPTRKSARGEHDRPNRSRRKTSTDKRKEAQAGTAGNRVLLFSGVWEVALYRAEVLRSNGFQVFTPRSKEEAVQTIRRGELDVAVLTYTLPNETVYEVATILRESCPKCPLITISDSGRLDRKIAPDATVIADQGPSALIHTLRRFTKTDL